MKRVAAKKDALTQQLRKLAGEAKVASYVLASLSVEKKNIVLRQMADALEAGRVEILKANQQDLAAARSWSV
jgi:gamma-glutamyl phosphate reductase